MSIANKQCSKCKEVKPIDEFHSDKTNLDGKRFDCTSCVSKRRKDYYDRNKESQKQYSREYRKSNLEYCRETMRSYQQKPIGRYAKLKFEAKRRGLSVEITVEEYAVIIASRICTYCEGAFPILGHGVDRKDSALGYTKENCVPCCGACNRIKNELLTYEEMLAVAKLLKEMRKL